MAKDKTSKSVHKARVNASSKNKKRNLVLGIVVLFVIVLAIVIARGTNNMSSKDVTIQTAKGTIVMEIYPKLMPTTVGNFEKLIKANFYNGLTFHRVEDWVIQGGDPKGNGTGGPGWSIPLEVNAQLKNVRGAVAMARGQDPNSAGSQFYILKKDAPWLDGQYAVFGKVIKGMEIVDQIQPGDKMELVKEN